jgi:hypothetical protein
VRTRLSRGKIEASLNSIHITIVSDIISSRFCELSDDQPVPENRKYIHIQSYGVISSGNLQGISNFLPACDESDMTVVMAVSFHLVVLENQSDLALGIIRMFIRLSRELKSIGTSMKRPNKVLTNE